MTTFIKNAHILTMDDDDTEYAHANILIEGGKIADIGPEATLPEGADARIVDASGLLAMPGLINAHVHSPGNFMKGALDDRPLEIFMLYEVPPLTDALPQPRVNYVRTMLGALEMLKSGITSVQDDAFYVPIPTPEAIDGLMQAYADCGIRATASLDQPNVVEYDKYPFLDELLPAPIRQKMERAPRMSTNELMDLYHYFVDRWHGACNGRIATAVSCSAPQRVTVDYFGALSELSRLRDLPFYIHTLETKLQRVLGSKKYGKSLVRYIHDLGFLDERTNIIHAIWVDDADMDLLAQSGCVVTHNPICNLKLGSGIMPFRQLRNRGIPICLGTDEATVDDTCNVWNVAKMAGLIHKITDYNYRNWPTAPEILWCLTRGGAHAMRANNLIGMLTPGYEADLILIDLNTLNFTPLNDLRRQLVFCENGSSVAMTIVAGEVVYENGHVTTVDEEAIKAEVREMMVGYGNYLGMINEEADELEPYYREMYLKAAQSDVGMNRWAGSY